MYLVNIDAEEQVVMVSGSVDSTILIKKLKKSGKHAEVLSPISHEKSNLGGQAGFISNEHNRINGSQRFKTLLGNDVQDQWHPGNYLNENMRVEAVRGEIDQVLMGNAYSREHQHRHGIPEYDARAMRIRTGLTSNGADFAGLGGQGYGVFQDNYARKPTSLYEHSPSMMIYNHPSAKITPPLYNTMVNHDLDYNSSLTFPYKDASMPSTTFTFY